MRMMTAGITSEEADVVAQMTKKRLRKWEGLAEEMQHYPGVTLSGVSDCFHCTSLLGIHQRCV